MIDFSEHSHCQMRTDLHADGRAKSVTASCNRIFCRQIRAEEIERSGQDPAEPEQRRTAPETTHPAILDNRQGNARIDWQNIKLEIYKELH